METKSRYEVIAELESKKRELIIQRDSINDNVNAMKKEIKLMKRELEDKEEELKEFEESIDEKKTTLNELIKSVDVSLERLTATQKK